MPQQIKWLRLTDRAVKGVFDGILPFGAGNFVKLSFDPSPRHATLQIAFFSAEKSQQSRQNIMRLIRSQ